MKEADYTRLTYDLTFAAAGTLARLNPQMTFIYVSGSGTDSSEKGRSMWARVKGKTENALKSLPFRAVYLFRPGVIEPLNGAPVRRLAAYRLFYTLALKPLLPTLRALLPNLIVSGPKTWARRCWRSRAMAPPKRAVLRSRLKSARCAALPPVRETHRRSSRTRDNFLAARSPQLTIRDPRASKRINAA